MELYELFLFLRQLGLAVAGATAFWGFIFLWFGRRKAEGKKREVLEWTANRLLIAFSLAFTLAASSWLVLWNIWPVLAHEGITLFPGDQEYRQAFSLTLPVYIFWIFFTLGALIFRQVKKESFQNLLPWFYAIQFLVVSVLISVYAWTGEIFSNEQIFFYFHGFHSIFTLGTVLTLDFLFLSTRFSLVRQKYLYPFFPSISKIIFIGLGLDFLSVYLVFGDAIEFSARFFLAQTVVGILIINGVFLAGPMTRKILNGLKENKILSGKWRFIAGISGSISIISWVTITFIDYFPNMTFSYPQLFTTYLLVILVMISVNLSIAWFDSLKLAKMQIRPEDFSGEKTQNEVF